MDGGLSTALASAALASNKPTVEPLRHDGPVPLPSEPSAPLSGPSGATAQTGGFVGTAPNQPTDGGLGAGGSGFGGGLASSPNVPRPGTTIDPNTGRPHLAGLTRAELEAKRALEATSTTPSGSGDPGASSGAVKGTALPELSGREQAARQLTGTAEDVITPGKELPGGWGPTGQVPVPGSGPSAPSSVYEDIAEGLEKVGAAAYNLIPKGLKDALNPEHPVDKGKQPMGSPPKARRSSVGLFFENVKQGTGAFLYDVQDTLQSERRVSIGSTHLTGSGGKEPSVIAQVKTFFAESVQTVESQTTAKVAAPTKTSLPSTEKAGALPGEHSIGVGALPGKSVEAGVAVLPDEKKLDPDLPLGNQTLRPGEVSGGVGDLPGKPSEAGVAVLPDEKKLDKDLPLSTDSSKNDATTPIAETSNKAVVPVSQPDSNSISTEAAAAGVATGLGATGIAGAGHSAAHYHASTAPSTGLAPPLPATYLGDGAAKGATDLEQAGLPTSPATTAPSSVSSTAAASFPDSITAVDSKHANDRTTSTASITAIRHGHEGNRSSPLAQDVTASKSAEPVIGEKESTSGLSQSLTSSLTPGNETEGVGHPSTRSETTTRSPAKYPAPNHSSHGTSAENGAPKPPTVAAAPTALTANPIKEETTDVSHSATSPSATPAKTPAAAAVSTDVEKGHRRTGSNASTGSNGKKKVGFMSKLKGEIKVIGGKLAHDEKKVEEGQKIKHGEL